MNLIMPTIKNVKQFQNQNYLKDKGIFCLFNDYNFSEMDKLSNRLSFCLGKLYYSPVAFKKVVIGSL